MKTFSDWFEVHGQLSQKQHDFLEALLPYAPRWEALGVSPLDVLTQVSTFLLTVALDVSAGNHVLRTLRVDFDGQCVLMGEDETLQLVTDLNEQNPEVLVHKSENASLEEFADVAGQWLERELKRVIVLHQWMDSQGRHRKWILEDVGHCIVQSDSTDQNSDGWGMPESTTMVWPPFTIAV